MNLNTISLAAVGAHHRVAVCSTAISSILCSIKIKNDLIFWYWFTQVVLEYWPLNKDDNDDDVIHGETKIIYKCLCDLPLHFCELWL